MEKTSNVHIGDVDLGTSIPLLLAPMEDVSDPPFRKLCKENGADVVYTEFISSEGLIRDAAKSVVKLDIFDYERPVGIQIFGGEIESMREATRIATSARPDIIDINFGCPVKKVVCKGAGAGILKDIPRMVEMTKAVIESTDLPVTVKTRLGWDSDSIMIEEVALRLQEVGIKALSIHGRTRKQMYKGVADWQPIASVKKHPDISIPIFGNGDIDSPEKAKQTLEAYPVDGLMIGRAAIGNPWIFQQIKDFLFLGKQPSEVLLSTKIEAIKEHLRLGVEWKGERLAIYEMRRHYTNYLRDMPNIKGVRAKLVECNELQTIFDTLDNLLSERCEIDPVNE